MRKHTPGPWQWNHGRLLHNVAGEYSERSWTLRKKLGVQQTMTQSL